jgi:hypothetical protein
LNGVCVYITWLNIAWWCGDSLLLLLQHRTWPHILHLSFLIHGICFRTISHLTRNRLGP